MGLINEAIRLRGLFVHRYSGVEWAVAALIVSMQQHSAYQAFTGLPWAWSGKGGKVRRLHRLLDAGGPLDSHAAEIRTYLAKFAELDERRNFLVHAIMTPERNPANGPSFRFAMYRSSPGGTDYGSMTATIEDMENLADAVQPISTGFSALVGQILKSVDLPPILAVYDPDAPLPFNLALGPRI